MKPDSNCRATCAVGDSRMPAAPRRSENKKERLDNQAQAHHSMVLFDTLLLGKANSFLPHTSSQRAQGICCCLTLTQFAARLLPAPCESKSKAISGTLGRLPDYRMGLGWMEEGWLKGMAKADIENHFQ